MNAPELFSFIQSYGVWLIVGLLVSLVILELATHAGERAKRLVEVFSILVGILVAVVFALGQSQYERTQERREAAAALLEVIEVAADLEVERLRKQLLNVEGTIRLMTALGSTEWFFDSSYILRIDRVLSDPSLFIQGDRFFVEVFLRSVDDVSRDLEFFSARAKCQTPSSDCGLDDDSVREHVRNLEMLRVIACLQRQELLGVLSAGAVRSEWTSERIWTAQPRFFEERTRCKPVALNS